MGRFPVRESTCNSTSARNRPVVGDLAAIVAALPANARALNGTGCPSCRSARRARPRYVDQHNRLPLTRGHSRSCSQSSASAFAGSAFAGSRIACSSTRDGVAPSGRAIHAAQRSCGAAPVGAKRAIGVACRANQRATAPHARGTPSIRSISRVRDAVRVLPLARARGGIGQRACERIRDVSQVEVFPVRGWLKGAAKFGDPRPWGPAGPQS
jgi:hypothetical protein